MWHVLEGSWALTSSGPSDIKERPMEDEHPGYLFILKQYSIPIEGWISTWRYYARLTGNEIILMVVRQVSMRRLWQTVNVIVSPLVANKPPLNILGILGSSRHCVHIIIA